MATSSLPTVSLNRPRHKVFVPLAYCLAPILLVLSAVGFWHVITMTSKSSELDIFGIYLFIALTLLPMTFFILLVVFATQRKEYDRFSKTYQARIDHLQKRLNDDEDFIHFITDYSPEAISIYDNDNNIWFANHRVSEQTGVSVNDLIGRSITKVYSHEQTRKLLVRLDMVRSQKEPLEALDQSIDVSGKVQFVKKNYQVVSPFGEFSGGVMVREENVTGLIVERERRETMLRQVIATLVAVVDRRDPYAAGHSKRVGELSRAIAEELVLTELEIETAEIAGSLMNFGKVLVSRSILTKTTALSNEELQRVRDSILTSSDILSIIDFVGPVVPTLRQVMERVDGTGSPNGLKGDQILITARILTVANAFVALASARAHRPSLRAQNAANRILEDADKIYDRNVVAALSRCIQNENPKLEWLRQATLSA